MLSASAWISPHDRVAPVRQSFADHTSVRLGVLHARSENAEADRDMAARSWHLAGLNKDDGALLDH